MMGEKTTLQWTFGDETPHQHGSSFRRGISPWRGLLLTVGVLLAMCAAGLGGFIFGRYQHVQELARTDLQAAIDLESWAWQAGNRNLFQSLLDPAAQGEWRLDLEQQFNTAAGGTQRVTIKNLSLAADRAQVVVQITEGGHSHLETRYYRLVNGQWRRTAPDVEDARQTS